MSLKLSNLASEKQVEWLKKLGYDGQGQYAPEKLTKAEAAKILDELFEQDKDAGLDDDQYSGWN